jgi:two-component system, cell cycle sensor histidine kinase and response regulator CckA
MSPIAPLRLLMVEDSADDAELEVRELRKSGLEIEMLRVETREALEPAVRTWKPDFVISDFSLPGMDGLAALDIVKGILPEVPFIFVSGTIGEERAIEAMKHGATDYVVKDRLGGLVIRVRRALDEANERAQRRRLEDELRQAQKMDALGRLAGAVAHDFNNLLTAILSYGELALEKMKPGDPARADVEQIYQAGESAVSLTRQLLSFSRKTPLELRPVDLNAVISMMTPLLSRLLGMGIIIEFKADPTVKAVRADPGGLEQIILNLAVNARDAMPQGGKLTIETSRADPGAAPKGFGKPPAPGSILLRVTDTGTGIDPKTLPRIFEPFFTTKGPDKGTGLGLSTVYGLVQTFGGSIAVASELGRGTTFWVHLPEVGVRESEKDATVLRPKLAVGHETILVAEDSPSIRRLVVHVLGAHGYTVLEAADGVAALRVFEEKDGKIDLLLADAVMPGMGGRELIEKLRQKNPALNVILMSGYTDGPEDGSASTCGCSQLAKPFTPIALAAQVRQVLDGAGDREAAPPPSKGRILTIDDDARVTTLLRTILEQEGFEVHAQNDPGLAVQDAAMLHPDLILLDFEMPKMLGSEVAALLKKNAFTKDIPVVFLSGMADEDHQAIGTSSGAAAYLSKPVARTRLIQTLHALIPSRG